MRQCCIAVAAVECQAVVEPLVAFHDADVSANRVAREAVVDLLRRHQVRIEVETGASAGLAQPHRVNIVRPFFKGLNPQALRRQCGAQADGDCRLTGGFVGSRNQQFVHDQDL